MFKTIKVANNFIFSGSNCIVLFLIISMLKSTKVMWHLLRIQVRMQLFVSVAYRDFEQKSFSICFEIFLHVITVTKRRQKLFQICLCFIGWLFLFEYFPSLASYVPLSLPALGAKTKIKSIALSHQNTCLHFTPL